MTKFVLAEDTTHFSNQNLVRASLDGAVSEQSDAVYAVGEEVLVLPGGLERDAEEMIHRRGWTQCSHPVGVIDIDVGGSPEVDWSGIRLFDMDSPASRGGRL